MPFPFEVSFAELQSDIDSHVDSVFGCLLSGFLKLPKGQGFVEYPVFEQAYEALKQATGNFRDLSPQRVEPLVYQLPMSLIVLRTILGFTPPELAYVASSRKQIAIDQGAARSLDRKIRLQPLTPLRQSNGLTSSRIRALVETACELLTEGAPHSEPNVLHRLDKADTKEGLASIQALADIGVPYAMMLYERFLGRPFAGHRDSVSELVGDVLEAGIEAALAAGKVSFRKTKRAERVTGFDQAPDFIVPDEFNPQVVIEAKITEDDGTARDKVTRIQHLGLMSMAGRSPDEEPRFQVIACIAGRGFRVRREDMRKLLLATRGKVFTLQNLDRLIECTRLRDYVAKPNS
jgi:hypothetical protein